MKTVYKILLLSSIIIFMICHNLLGQEVSIGNLRFEFTDSVTIKELGDLKYEFAYGSSKTVFHSSIDNFSDSIKNKGKDFSSVEIKFNGEFTRDKHHDGFDPTNKRTLDVQYQWNGKIVRLIGNVQDVDLEDLSILIEYFKSKNIIM